MSGQNIINLNIGNPAPFGLYVPDEIVHDMILNIQDAQGYSHHLVFFCPKSGHGHTQELGNLNVTIDDAFIGKWGEWADRDDVASYAQRRGWSIDTKSRLSFVTVGSIVGWGKPVHYICDE